MTDVNDLKVPTIELVVDKQADEIDEDRTKRFQWARFHWFKRLFFLDVDGLVHYAFKASRRGGRLEPRDMYPEQTVQTSRITSIFEPAFEKQKERQAQQIKDDKQALQELDNHLQATGQPIPPKVPPKSLTAGPGGPPGRGPPGSKPAITDKSKPGADAKTNNTSAAAVPAEQANNGDVAVGKAKLTKDQQRRVKLQQKIDTESSYIDLRRVVLAGNVKTIVFTGVLYLISQACSLAGPLLLRRIVAGIQCQPFRGKIPGLVCEPKSTLYFYCLGLFLAPLIQSLCDNQQTFMLYLTGTRMRNSLMAAIYRKCLRLSNSALQEESTGRVVTLMSNDAQKLQDAMIAIHSLWGSPAYIVAVLVLLWYQVGWATFVGLGVMLLIAPMTGKLATKLGGLRRELLKWTDKRVGYMNEVISGIQMIKFYAWEPPFATKVQGARSQEARILRTTAAWSGFFAMILFSGPVLVAVCCFGAYTLAGNQLTVADAYAALALFSLLRFPMSFLPMLITMVINALIALRRIGSFLNRDESSLSKEVLDDSYAPGFVTIKDGEFTWDTTQSKSTIKDINMEAWPGSLTMIVGSVGSGKSSVLGALVGHMSKVSGSIKVGGKVAYVAQTAWIMNDTLQENVLLGDENMDGNRYVNALKVSQLGPDLEILPNHDLTEIGDRGVTLSGGQKQRVSIARAVYADADVYILDDPLSAVDSHVGRALFEECIRGVLKDKTVILVTNALQYLPMADNVLWMEDGRIRAQGTYKELVEQGMNIAELQMHEKEEVKKEDERQDGGLSSAGPSSSSQNASSMDSSAEKLHGHIKTTQESSSQAVKKAHLPTGLNPKHVTLTRSVKDSNRNLTGVEERETGNLSLGVIKQYISGGGGLPVFVLLVLLFALEQGARVYTDRWVGIWSTNQYRQSLGFYLGIYAGLGVFYGMCTYARSLRFLFMCVRASVSLHNRLLAHLLRLPKQFFDTNPAGRILNRFSRDTDIMDATLPSSLVQSLNAMATYISILVVISIATKWFAIALLPLTIVYVCIQRYYIPTARELQRIESISRSPIYSKFAEALLGVSTIRAYRKEAHFTKMSDELMESNSRAFVTQKLASSWLAMRLDALGLLVLTGCGALVIQGNVNPGLAGLALVYALDLTRFLKVGTNMAAKAEADFNSVERIIQYLRPETEAPPDTRPEVMKTMPDPWPSLGTVEVADLTLRYRPELPLVLQGVSFRVEGGEKVGLVGRTGSGKSSILLALFRMIEPTSGHIYIDGVDICTLGVRHLRSKMSIIPQDPFMFSGTVRNNLDPLDAHDDHKLWEVLEAVGLKRVVTELDGSLGAKVVDNGANFSLGQRQLICLARAMLRNSRILMLDEATASVDVETDAALQTAIRSTFEACTMLTIAHRLNTIMDSDKVVVLDAGRVVECDHPDNLLQTDEGVFTRMVSQTGRSSERYLRSLASMALQNKKSGKRAMSSVRSNLGFGNGAKSFGTALKSDPTTLATGPYLTIDQGDTNRDAVVIVEEPEGVVEASPSQSPSTSSQGSAGANISGATPVTVPTTTVVYNSPLVFDTPQPSPSGPRAMSSSPGPVSDIQRPPEISVMYDDEHEEIEVEEEEEEEGPTSTVAYNSSATSDASSPYGQNATAAEPRGLPEIRVSRQEDGRAQPGTPYYTPPTTVMIPDADADTVVMSASHAAGFARGSQHDSDGHTQSYTPFDTPRAGADPGTPRSQASDDADYHMPLAPWAVQQPHSAQSQGQRLGASRPAADPAHNRTRFSSGYQRTRQ